MGTRRSSTTSGSHFYLQDTKSSNGTFINSQRLSRGSEESPPCEVLSGDSIQFGVDFLQSSCFYRTAWRLDDDQ
ncbi:unnamed protein product, partial [Coregonus sp. 'balchen']